MPQQSHHKGREREQGKRGPGAEREGKGRGKQSGAWRAGEEQRRWAREKRNKQNIEAPRPQTPKSARRERNMTPRIGASGARGSTARAPGLDRPGVNPVPRTRASEATGRIRQKDAPEWSCRGGMKHSINPRTGSSGGEPGATDWSVRGGGESTTKRPPGLEQPGGNEARRKPLDWIVRG